MVRRNMTNNEIYMTALALTDSVANLNLHLPIKANFYMQKNISAILSIAEEVEKARSEILQKHGTPDETGNYNFDDDTLEEVNKELVELFSLEQEVPIYEITLDAFGDAELDSKQVKAISYMIKEEE